MREDIKERIELIRAGKVPEGYKKTRLGIIPEDFKIVLLGELVDFQNGINAEKEKFSSGIKIISVSDILKEEPIFYDAIKSEIDISEEKLENYAVNYGDILFQRSSENIEDAGTANVYLDKRKKATFGGFVIRGKKKTDYNPIVINEILKMQYVRKQVMKMAAGAQHINISQDSLKRVWIAVPNATHQKYVENILKAYLKQNDLLQKKMELVRFKKKYLMQSLLSGKRRIHGFNKTWEKVRLSAIFKEIDDRTIENNEYPILSVTKNGICLQSEHFNKQIASYNNIGYKIVKKGNLVFSTMNLWMGSLDVLEEFDIGIVSPAYKVYDFDENMLLPEFVKYYMKSEHMMWLYNINSEQGASIVRKNLDLTGLLNNFVSIPEIAEQKSITEIFRQIDYEINLLEKKIILKKKEKKALMQLLLTGIVRVSEE
ncbi:MAG: hypothetical protein HFJ10_14755 [Lachnospiraceae bacterium]|nr:hypothetical protein [Lachnospiraceae bacterium]